MNKKVVLGILLGFSIHLLFENYLRYVDGNMDKLYLRTGLSALILIGLYMKEFRIKNNFYHLCMPQSLILLPYV